MPTEELSTRSTDIEKISPEDFYPTVTEIIADPTVKAAMDSAWIETLSLANKNGRQEIGFYIYYDFDKKEYEIGEKKYGPIIPNEENTYGSLILGSVKNNITVCAIFHTHTPTLYMPTGTYRITGPSDLDKSYAEKYGLPGIVYDYASKKIYGGHKLNSPAKLYTFGRDHRKNSNNENDR